MTTIAASETIVDPSSPTLRPTQPEERIATLDILRGFALLGICVINLPGFYMPWFFYSAGEELYPRPIDWLATWMVDFVGSGKFNSLFSFLFGVGFAIQMDRAEAKGLPFAGTYLRRLAVLFTIGVAHCFLIWNGDVLHIYAIIGLPLLFVKKLPDRWLWALAAVLLVIPIAHGGWKYYKQKADPHDRAYWRDRAENQLRVYGKGDYGDLVARFTKSAPKEPRPVIGQGSWPLAVKERFRETREGYLEHGEIFFWPILGTTMLIGFIVGRRRVFRDLPAHLPKIRRLALWTGILGVVLAAVFATCGLLMDHEIRTPTLLGLFGSVFYVLNRPVLACFYVCVLVLLASRPSLQTILRPLAIVGRMPLTNYLMQSILASLIFYGYGLGYFGRVTPSQGVLIAFGIYAFQVAYSIVWIRFFHFGPAEWLWRTLTYGKAPAMTVAA